MEPKKEDESKVKVEEEISTSSNPQQNVDDKAPLKYIFQTVDDPSHYSNIFTKENFKTKYNNNTPRTCPYRRYSKRKC